MKIISFELTMPSVNSWNGKWSGADRKYYVVKKVSDSFAKKSEHLKDLFAKGKDYWHYDFGDGWAAGVYAEIIDSKEVRKRKKISAGFCGYNWMIDSIMSKGEITTAKYETTN